MNHLCPFHFCSYPRSVHLLHYIFGFYDSNAASNWGAWLLSSLHCFVVSMRFDKIWSVHLVYEMTFALSMLPVSVDSLPAAANALSMMLPTLAWMSVATWVHFVYHWLYCYSTCNIIYGKYLKWKQKQKHGN